MLSLFRSSPNQWATPGRQASGSVQRSTANQDEAKQSRDAIRKANGAVQEVNEAIVDLKPNIALLNKNVVVKAEKVAMMETTPWRWLAHATNLTSWETFDEDLHCHGKGCLIVIAYSLIIDGHDALVDFATDHQILLVTRDGSEHSFSEHGSYDVMIASLPGDCSAVCELVVQTNKSSPDGMKS